MKSLWKRLILIGILGAVVILINPVNSKVLKLGFLACLVGVWSGATVLSWKSKRLRITALILPLLAAIPFILPGREINADELRLDYVRRLSHFEGTRYYWGGESSLGIDCSGLPRRALRDALLSYGVRHLNRRAFRYYVEQWWYDASAKALSEGYRAYTVPIEITGTIRELDYEVLDPGDLAVTIDGIHVLVYVGEGKWIQAAPEIGTVATLDGRTDNNGWFHRPVTIHRWQLLVQH